MELGPSLLDGAFRNVYRLVRVSLQPKNVGQNSRRPDMLIIGKTGIVRRLSRTVVLREVVIEDAPRIVETTQIEERAGNQSVGRQPSGGIAAFVRRIAALLREAQRRSVASARAVIAGQTPKRSQSILAVIDLFGDLKRLGPGRADVMFGAD